MKVRFYRGPLNGHVRMVADHQHVIEFARPVKFSKKTERVDFEAVLGVRYDRYYRTRYMHPDGSVFFEWDQPRRKK